MTTLVIPQTLWPLVSHVDPGGRETAGIALARIVEQLGSTRLLVHSVLVASSDDYADRGAARAVLSPTFVARGVDTARRDGSAVVFFHTHPLSERATFSSVDDDGEMVLAEFLRRRVPGRPHVGLVLGRDSHSARLLGTRERIPIVVVGPQVRRWDRELSSPEPETSREDAAFDRQVRVFGAVGQQRLSTLSAAVIGLGGTGSFVAQELAHLGVHRFVLVDPDIVDVTNLNRVAGAEPSDQGQSAKVDVAARLVRRIQPSAEVEAIRDSVLAQRIARALVKVDVIFACTDSHGSRQVLNQIAYQYLVPVIDFGVVIIASDGTVSHVFGRAQMLAPGLPCLTCLNTLDPEQVRRDLMSDYERQNDPYVVGDALPQPAVVSINATVSSLGVTMFLSAFTGVPVETRYQLYDAIRGVVRPIRADPQTSCVTCSPTGAFARGDTWPAPGRTA